MGESIDFGNVKFYSSWTGTDSVLRLGERLFGAGAGGGGGGMCIDCRVCYYQFLSK